MSELGQIVGVDWLVEHLCEPGIVVVDTRPYQEYSDGHIPGARHSDQNSIRMRDSSDASIAQFVRDATAECERVGLQPGDRVGFYEAISGCYAARGVWMLDYLGIPGGALLDGGLVAWVEAGGELASDLPEAETTTLDVVPDQDVLYTAGQILDGFSGQGERAIVL